MVTIEELLRILERIGVRITREELEQYIAELYEVVIKYEN